MPESPGEIVEFLKQPENLRSALEIERHLDGVRSSLFHRWFDTIRKGLEQTRPSDVPGHQLFEFDNGILEWPSKRSGCQGQSLRCFDKGTKPQLVHRISWERTNDQCYVGIGLFRSHRKGDLPRRKVDQMPKTFLRIAQSICKRVEPSGFETYFKAFESRKSEWLVWKWTEGMNWSRQEGSDDPEGAFFLEIAKNGDVHYERIKTEFWDMVKRTWKLVQEANREFARR